MKQISFTLGTLLLAHSFLGATTFDKRQALEYLNTLRSSVHLNTLQNNTLLQTAAQNHTNYVKDTHLSGHYEDNATYPSEFYTGVKPFDRGIYVGYLSSHYSENFSSGQTDFKSSIDNLMSAIYHRYGFLNNNIDEMGIGVDETLIYTYNMANSRLNELCHGESYEDGSESYTYKVCADEDFKVKATTYNEASHFYQKTAPDVIVWPFENQKGSMPVFFEENPDPLPEQSVSGYPISLEFNAYKYEDSTITMKSFQLFDSYDNEITNTFLMKEDTDPNERHTKFQFTLFPLDRLAFNQTYKVKAIYDIDGVENLKEWQFSTKNYEYPYFVYTQENQEFKLHPNVTYMIYFPPRNKNDIFDAISYTYNTQKPEIKLLDGNTLLVKLNGNNTNHCNVEMKKNSKTTTSITCIIDSSATIISPQDDVTLIDNSFVYYNIDDGSTLKTNIQDVVQTSSTYTTPKILNANNQEVSLSLSDATVQIMIDENKYTMPKVQTPSTINFVQINNNLQVQINTTLTSELIFEGQSYE